ncbi:MAG: hypothetical protein AAGC65_11130 [Mucilaginibacter sp.]|uniref:hypothetical protein n=1 Tax=Mucilaginibacter sp. TaxID=1882438 RepID=UPI0031B1426D
MKVTVFGLVASDKEQLAKANQKKHEITLISNELSPETVTFAHGKDAVITYGNGVSSAILNHLNRIGVKIIFIPPLAFNDLTKQSAANLGIKLATTLSGSAEAAEYMIQILDSYSSLTGNQL